MDAGMIDGFCFHAFSDGTRQKIIQLLKEQELCVSDICKHFDISQPSISHHLDILKRAGIVTSHKQGRQAYYSLNRRCLEKCCAPFFRKVGLYLDEAQRF